MDRIESPRVDHSIRGLFLRVIQIHREVVVAAFNFSLRLVEVTFRRGNGDCADSVHLLHAVQKFLVEFIVVAGSKKCPCLTEAVLKGFILICGFGYKVKTDIKAKRLVDNGCDAGEHGADGRDPSGAGKDVRVKFRQRYQMRHGELT
jgi:hypothetical protein